MVIKLHIEGGSSRNQDIEMRRAFRKFFGVLDQVAEDQGSSLKLTLHGTRRAAYTQFCYAHNHEPETYHVLLVDSEDPVQHPGECWRHLREREADGWERPGGVEEAQCQLMVEAIESWLFADPDCLAGYYGTDFQKSSLPGRRNVEEIPKQEHLVKLQAATRHTQKGVYHKTRHLPDLLRTISTQKVRERAEHCDRLFVNLSQKLGATLPTVRSA